MEIYHFLKADYTVWFSELLRNLAQTLLLCYCLEFGFLLVGEFLTGIGEEKEKSPSWGSAQSIYLFVANCQVRS